MSTKAYQAKARERWAELPPPCMGVCGYALEPALKRVTQAHPKWSPARQRQRALVEMVKRGVR
jgi:hypothetical protein